MDRFLQKLMNFLKNFLDFRLDRIKKHGIISFSSYTSKNYAFELFSDFEVAFNRKRDDAAFCLFLYCVLFIHSIAWSKKYVVRFSCLPYFKRYFIKSCSFSAFNFFFLYSITFFHHKLSWFMPNWLLIIFLIGLSKTLWEFLSEFLKCSFHFYNLSSCLATFSFALEALFLLFTSFTVSHTNCDCLSFIYLVLNVF